MGNIVEHPPHYNSGKIEVIEAIEDWGLGFHLGNVVKYVARAGKKDPAKEVEDLEKASWYLKRKIEILKAAKEKRQPIRPNDMNPRSTSATFVSNFDPSEKLPATVKTAPKKLPTEGKQIFEVGDYVRFGGENGSVGKILAIRPGVRWTMYEVEWTFGLNVKGERMLGVGSYTDAQIVPISKHEYEAVNTRYGFE